MAPLTPDPGHPDRSPRLYADLALWWPVISPPSEYEDEADEIRRLFVTAGTEVSTVLELGSGGGHNAVHLSRHFQMTLVDLSAEMIDVSRRLNPTSEHVRGDMRSVRLERVFDGVFIHDAVAYLLTEDDLAATLATAWLHLQPGGVLVVAPDHVAETFQPYTDHGGSDLADGRSARYLEWVHDADGTRVVVDYVFVLQGPEGRVEAIHDRHVNGVFAEDTWLSLLDGAGFETGVVEESTVEDRVPRRIFRARKRET